MADIDDFREQKDEFFAQGHGSPLEHDQQHDFSGLDYFPENPSLRFEVDPERFDNPEEVRMMTSTGDIAEFRRWGQVRFSVDGQIAELALYQDIHQGHLFIPFTDATSGTDTYGAGRYLDPVLLDLFVRDGLYLEYARRYMLEELIDDVDAEALLAIEPSPVDLPPEEERSKRAECFLPEYRVLLRGD